MSDVYRQALAKCDWANKHIEKLKATIGAWREIEPCSIGIKQNVNTGDVTYYVANVPVIPDDVPLIIGDVLHNFRCALDYMACGLVGSGRVTSKTKFPIRRDSKDWEESGLRMVDGASEEAIEALRRIRPYEGGNGLLYILQTLNNIDKHRLLLTVSLKNTGRMATKGEQVIGDLLDEEGTFWLPSGLVVKTSTDISPVPLYTGQELLTIPAAQANQDVGFFVEVAFSESGQCKGMQVIAVLVLMSGIVAKTIRELAVFV
jgi:hypothetical protein